MDSGLLSILKEICGSLNENNVDYLIIGGTAVGIHGFSRESTNASGDKLNKYDIDIWFRPIMSNYHNVLNALKSLGDEVSKYQKEAANPKKSFLKYEHKNYNLDLLPEIPGFDSFSKAFINRITSQLDGCNIYIISKEDLIKSKTAVLRKKDIEDIKHLKNDSWKS